MKKPRHLFFDMDGTLTKSRSPISKAMVAELRAFMKDGGSITIVSGATTDQIFKQVGANGGLMPMEVSVLAQNGNDCLSDTLNIRWENELSWREKYAIFEYINAFIKRFRIRSKHNLVEDRGCQVSFSLLGHDAPKDKKAAFDPTRNLRRSLLKEFPFRAKGIEVRIGGTTCLDFTIKGANKGSNVDRFVRIRKWKRDDCLYIGDALEKGGNDETVVGVIPTMAVKDEKDCLDAMKSINQLPKKQGKRFRDKDLNRFRKPKKGLK